MRNDMPADDAKPRVLFACRTNSGRSQMAKAFFRTFTHGRVTVIAAVIDRTSEPDAAVIESMAEAHIDYAGCEPVVLTPAIAASADYVVAMNCAIDGLVHVDADWKIPDPAGKTPAEVRAIRDAIRDASATLAERFLEAVTPAT
jgi:arsenate reductase